MPSYEQFKNDFEAKQQDATGASKDRLAKIESRRQEALDARAKQIKSRVRYVWKSIEDNREPPADAKTLETDTKDFVKSMARSSSLPEDLEQRMAGGNNMMVSKKSIGSGDALTLSRHGAIPRRRSSVTRGLRNRDNVIQFNDVWTKVEDGDDGAPKVDGMNRLLPPSKTKREGCFGPCQEDGGKDGAVLQRERETMQLNIVAVCIYVCFMIWYINVNTDLDLASLFLSARRKLF